MPTNLTAAQLRRAAELMEEVERILSGGHVHAQGEEGAFKAKRVMSPETRARMAAAARQRWKRAKEAGRNRL